MSVSGSIIRKDPAEASRAAIRREQILSIASGLFAKSHFEATSMRDIAAAADITPAALYYHFVSKEALFVAVHGESIRRISAAVEAAIARQRDPWTKFEAAAIAHLETMLDEEDFSVFLAPILPHGLSDEARTELTAQRDRYVRLIDALVADLPLSEGTDRHIFRLHFLSALNGSAFWYRPGKGLKPKAIALQLCAMIKNSNFHSEQRPRMAVLKTGEETERLPWEFQD